jgi:endonuclease/exonuclease/phosphatase family metal-dependent hydrolase
MSKTFCICLVLVAAWSSLPAKVITVAAYNVENFCLEDRMVDGVFKQKYPKPEKEKAALIQVIKAIKPDVLAIEEMGGQEFLDELQYRLKLAGLVYPHSVVMPGGDPQRHLAILSREEFQPVQYQDLYFLHEGKRVPVLRGLLEAKFQTPEGEWDLFVVHLKSRLSHDMEDLQSADYRQGEAARIRDQIIRAEQDSHPFLVVGDFNDDPKSSALRRFVEKGDLRLTEMLHPVDSRGEEWTEHWAGHGSFGQIDYILASPNMEPHVIPASEGIYDGPGSTIASDHRPVYVRIDTAQIQP